MTKFIIQRSIDGNTFSNIGIASAIGNGNHSYSFIDATKEEGSELYYRLQAMDKDGGYIYSPIASLALITHNSSLITIFPNPAKDVVTIKGNNIAQVQIINAEGKLITTNTLKDATNPSLRLAGLPAGVYLLSIKTTNGEVSVLKLVKE